MEMTLFAIESGYAQGISADFTQYTQIRNCSSIEELKSFLEDTDYGDQLRREGFMMSVASLRGKLKQKLADEVEYVECNSTGALVQFLGMVRIKYQLENVVNVIEGLKNKVEMQVLMSGMEPLGLFPEMRNIKVLEGDDYSGLYRDVLIDTPVGPYFMRFLEEKMGRESGQSRTMTEVQNIFKELKPQEIRSYLKRLWLEDFYEFCTRSLNPTSAAILQDLVSFEADFKTIQVPIPPRRYNIHNTQVVYNSISNRELNNAIKVTKARTELCPALGYLYPDSKGPLMNANNLEQLKDALRGCSNYAELVASAPDPSKKEDYNPAQRSLDDIMYDEECKRYALAFDQCNQIAVFYAYIKLKEQEIRNVIWLAEMISRSLSKNHTGWKKIIIPFSHLQ